MLQSTTFYRRQEGMDQTLTLLGTVRSPWGWIEAGGGGAEEENSKRYVLVRIE